MINKDNFDMKNNSLIILVLYFSPIFGQWQEINTPTNEDLTKIEIIDGVAFCGGRNGVLLKSIDQGETWSKIITDATGNITSILFIDSYNGFFTTSEGKIFRTSDKGLNWIEKFVDTLGINGIDFKNTSTGIAVGDNGNIVKTLDGGDNWINLGSQSIYRLNDIAFLNDSCVITVGPSGSYLFSTNTGDTWTQKKTNLTETFFAVEKIDASKASIVGTGGSYCEFHESNLTIGEISKIDSGEDWLKDIHIIEKEDGSSKGIIVGFNSSLYIESDGWKNQDIDFVNNLNSIHFYDDTIGVACGFNGKIYKTISGGVPASISKPTQFDLKIYPNPAKNKLFLKEGKSFKSLVIYNYIGQVVINQKVVNNQIDISGIPKGHYYVALKSREKFETRKFLKK